MNKKAQILLISLIIIGILILLLLLYVSRGYNNEPSKIEECNSTNCVSRIIDGDTFVIRTGESVRLICINTPERTDTGYFEATKFLRDLIEDKEVRLEKDVSETDMYNRLLRYVYVNQTLENGTIREVFVNRELYQQGYAEIMRYPPDVKRCDEIKGA